ncbi:hypothetical protein OZ411_07115 [Bradyrhizobium sp. Arg237L]|uniref:hypothetical protein n=1 Tax=Bradyrhizobium sp. Arg237L TaxID=3003352 RepID=UPI00249F8C5B|nr:hypothetical protein [Bradyrhizobium sp. Arg237L]MDI4232581.1 hypothetical protein [Bradyrhizobium sp. Arg237L]
MTKIEPQKREKRSTSLFKSPETSITAYPFGARFRVGLLLDVARDLASHHHHRVAVFLGSEIAACDHAVEFRKRDIRNSAAASLRVRKHRSDDDGAEVSRLALPARVIMSASMVRSVFFRLFDPRSSGSMTLLTAATIIPHCVRMRSAS